MGDDQRIQRKDPSMYDLFINSDGRLISHSDSYPDMKQTKKSLDVAVPAGNYEGSMPSIIDISLDTASPTIADLDNNISTDYQKVKCPTETIAISYAAVIFPNGATTGDCVGDNLRTQMKDPSKYASYINSDGRFIYVVTAFQT